jgi:hypothetical protein
MRKVVAAEGVSVLATGLGATAAGYFVQVCPVIIGNEPLLPSLFACGWHRWS